MSEGTFSTNRPADHFPLGVLPTERKRELEEAMPAFQQLFIPRPTVTVGCPPVRYQYLLRHNSSLEGFSA
jgi:hypothetical protein